MTVTIDSNVYKMTFYGILNANGAFWTPLAFDSSEKAERHLNEFWSARDAEWQGLREKFKIVPVRIQLTALAPVDRNPEGEKPQALSAKHESAVGEAEAPCHDTAGAQGGDA